MSIASYTLRIQGELDRTGEARLPFSNQAEQRRMRSRVANAARRKGLLITTTVEDGHVVARVLGWKP